MNNPAVSRDNFIDQVGITRRLGLKQVGIRCPSYVVDSVIDHTAGSWH